MSPETKRTAIVVGGITITMLGLGLLGFAWASGAAIDVGAILGGVSTLIGSAAILLGLRRPAPIDAMPHRSNSVPPVETPLPRPGRGRGRESRGAGPLVALLLAGGLALSCSACGGAACQTERTIVSALDAGVEGAALDVGVDAGDEWDSALRIARGATELGAAAVGACELARDGAGWESWVGLALESAGALVGLISGAPGGVPDDVVVPPELARAVELLEAEE